MRVQGFAGYTLGLLGSRVVMSRPFTTEIAVAGAGPHGRSVAAHLAGMAASSASLVPPMQS